MTLPLAGVRVIEIASIGPGPFCAMVLADHGAEVVRIERPMAAAPDSDPPPDPLLRGRKASIAVDLKHSRGPEILLDLVARSDVLIEGFRPGVMERLGVGPEPCLERNPALVYGRMTGWGQEGPRAREAGHDIDYLAVAGSLHPIGPADRPPPPPLNLVADFGGGGLLLAFGICAALVDRHEAGFRGRVIDAAMVDGAVLLSTLFHGLRATGSWSDARESNLLDGAAPFYRSYRTADDRFVAVGAIEPAFYAEMIEILGLGSADLPPQYDVDSWPVLADRLEAAFATKTRTEWRDLFAGSDACVVPVNDLGEAPADPHMTARGSFVEVGGVVQPGAAPRFDGTAPTIEPARPPGADTAVVLGELGYSDAAIEELRAVGAVV